MPFSVHLKGEGGTYSLALWSDGEFSYSLHSAQGWNLEQWRSLFLSMTSN